MQFTRQNVANFSSGKLQMYYDTDDGVADKKHFAPLHMTMVQLNGKISVE